MQTQQHEGLTDAQIAVLDKLTTIRAEQDCMIREAKRAHDDIARRPHPSLIDILINFFSS